MKKTAKKRTKKTPPPEGDTLKDYSITLVLGDKVFTSHAATIAKALRSLPRPVKITTKGVLTLEGDGRRFERLFRPQELRRFLWPVSSEINAKIISVALK